MSNFNFNSLSESSFVSNSANYLKPYDIYQVSLNNISKGTLKGKDGTEYNIVTVEFKGENGIYKENIFVPHKDEDFVRRVNETSGAHYPSSFEQFQFTLMQLVQVINPTGATKIIENASKLKTIDQFIDLVIKALSGKKDVNVYLKLVGRQTNNSWFAALPSACVLGRDATDDTKPSPLNFVSLDKTKLSFSNYEMTQMNKYKNAKPTSMPKDEEETPDSKEEDLNLDDIEV